MTPPTLDERIAAAGAALATAETFTARNEAHQAVNRLNAEKLVGLHARTNPATGAIEAEPATTHDVTASLGIYGS